MIDVASCSFSVKTSFSFPSDSDFSNALVNDLRKPLQEDGGDIEFVAVDEATGVVEVRLQGACVGCPMAKITMTQGVEATIKEALDFVTEDLDVTNHEG